tara:strand:- start:3117 stop:4265 length:1149 start_codon:yes stop_codon:yes gene_type:complete
MSKELVELSELYSQIITEDKDAEDAKKERELETTLKNLKNKKQEDNRPRITVGGKTYYKGDPGYDAAMKKSGPDEASGNSPEGVIKKDQDAAFDAKFKEQEKTVEKSNPNYGMNGKLEKDNKARAKEVSPASFSTSQRQTRELVKKNSDTPYPKIEKSDLNQFNRSKSYTANDGKTQVDRSTVFTKHYKTGKPLGVMGKSQRQKYDLEAAAFKAGQVKEPKVETVPSKFAANKDKPTFQRRDQKLLDKGLKPPTYTRKVKTSNVKINPTLDNDVKEGYGNKDKKKKKKKMYEGIDAYDSVLNYLIGTNQAQSVEEANYIMMEMDGKTIMEIKKIINESEINRADIRGGSKAVEYARQGKGNYTPGAGVTKDFQLDPNFKIKA